MNRIPTCFWIWTDLLFESLLRLIRRNPLYLLLIPLWLLRGRARLKHQLARRVALGSDGNTNLKAGAKLRRIREITGGGEFAYAGDSRADLPIWEQASQAILVNCSGRVSERLWLIVPLLLALLSRIWLLSRAGKLHEDPVLFAVKDRLSQLFVLAAGSLIWLAA